MFYLSKIRNETISRIKVIPEEIQRIKLKLFHLTSILFLRVFISSDVMDSKKEGKPQKMCYKKCVMKEK
jgi:hypothetical protein